MRSGIVLAGGNSSRFGEEKAFHQFRGKKLVEHVLERVSASCDEIILVVRNGGDLTRYGIFPGCRAVADIEGGRGPLMGMYSGLLSARGEEALVVGADMPFLSPRLIDFIFTQLAGNEAVIPRFGDGKLEPLLSVYRTRPAAEACRRALELGKRRMVSSFGFLRARYIPVVELKLLDPGLESLVNINSREDLDAVEREKSKD